jgi:hypothetical protein
MSPSSLPILRPQLGTFFAAENEKECDEGVTQCQRYIGEFLWILNYTVFNSRYAVDNLITLQSNMSILYCQIGLSSKIEKNCARIPYSREC